MFSTLAAKNYLLMKMKINLVFKTVGLKPRLLSLSLVQCHRDAQNFSTRLQCLRRNFAQEKQKKRYFSVACQCEISTIALDQEPVKRRNFEAQGNKSVDGDVSSCNVMITRYVRNGRIEDARQLFDRMVRRDVVSWTAMVSGYAQNGRIDDARGLFDKMPERNVISWTAMLSGYIQNGRIDEAYRLFEKMPERNIVSWNTMIAGYIQKGKVECAHQLFDRMPERNVVSWNTMLVGYVQNAYVDEALKLFQKIPERNIVSWSAMIAGCAQNGQFDDALMFFRQMQVTGVKPNLVTYASVLPACANLAVLQQGKEVHEDIIRTGFLSNVFVESALVDMYAKCGSIQDARKVFDNIPVQDVFSWNAMVLGYATHGRGKEALQLFERMQHSGTKPDHVTFLGVLSACCHAGLVDDGWQYFKCMSGKYHIAPAVEHYCCMVDLLGRAGRLDEAHVISCPSLLSLNAQQEDMHSYWLEPCLQH